MYTVYRATLCLLFAILIVSVTGCGERVLEGDAPILAVMQASEDGWNSGSLEDYMNCYRQSSELRFVGGDKISFGWHKVLDNYNASYPNKSQMGHLTFSDLDVEHLSDDAALVVGRWRLDRLSDQPHGAFTLLMRRDHDGWRITHDHTSSSDGTLSAAEASITEDELLERVTHLTSEPLGGRLPGTNGYRLAAEYVAQEFADMGLQPGGNQGYFQSLPMETNEVIGNPVFRQVGSSEIYQLGQDFVFRGFTGEGSFTAPVVFCGYGVSQPERGYDDYANIDVEGKIVLVFKQAPSWELSDGDGWQGLTNPRPKANTAADHGALAVLLVSRPNDSRPQPLIGSVMHGDGVQPKGVPQLHISQEVATDLLKQKDLSLADLQSRIDDSNTPASMALGTEVEVIVETRYQENAETWNVIGILPGSDPDLRTEAMVLGAHLDHVGVQAGKAIFPGANDNASGSAAILEIAEAFTRANKPPMRTLVFVLFAGEEQGLIGSQYYVDHPVRPLDETVTMFNFDCVAHGDSLKVGGGKSAPLLWGKALQMDAMDQGLMSLQTWGHGGADATPFHKKGLPTLYFVTKNSYTHLHQTSDTVETLNGPLFEAMVRLGYRTATWVADGTYQREWLPAQ